MNDSVTRRTFVASSKLAAAILVATLLLAGSTTALSQTVLSASTSVALFRIAIVGLVHPHAGAVWDMLKRTDIKIVGISEANQERSAQFVNKGLDRRLVFTNEAEMIEETHPQAVLIYRSAYGPVRYHCSNGVKMAVGPAYGIKRCGQITPPFVTIARHRTQETTTLSLKPRNALFPCDGSGENCCDPFLRCH